MRCLFVNLLLFATLIISCKGSRSIVGQYKYRNSSSTTFLTIDSSKKFTYNSYGEMIHVFSEGIWWSLDDTLYLKSSDDIAMKNGSVVESYVDSISSLTILKFIDQRGDNLQNLEIAVNGYDTVVSNKDGLIRYNKPIDFIFLKFYSNYDFFYRKKNPQSNLLVVTIYPADNENKYFMLKKYMVKRRKLLSPMGVLFIRQ